MAIDLPETIPSIINSFRRSSSAKTLQKFTRTLKGSEKTFPTRYPFIRPKSCKLDHPCRCGQTSCKDCQSQKQIVAGFDDRIKALYTTRNGAQSEGKCGEADCEQTLLTCPDGPVSDLTRGKTYKWNEGDEFSNQSWTDTNGTKDNYYGNDKLLKTPNGNRKRRKRGILLSTLGLTLISLAIFIRLFDPLEKILNWKLSLAPGSFALSLWLAPPVTIYVKIYIFNFTNPDEFLAGKQKLRVQQLGPYVYTEQLVNTNPVFNANGTLSYVPRRTVTHIPELSVANPKTEQVVVPNIPFLGIASMVSESSAFTNLGFLTLTKYLGSQPFLNLTVHDYLWGYEDPLVSMANKIVATKIPFSKFGLLDRMYDEGDNVITIRLSDNGLKMTDKGYLPQYSIDTWNGSPGLSTWGYKPEDFKSEGPIRLEPHERCKVIRGASEGVIFPRNVSPKIVHQVFRKNFCRMIPLVFEKEGVAKNGIPAYWYKLPEDVFDTPDVNPAQACYCNPNSTKCLPKGLSDITPCYYNIPAAVSFPHFLAADPKLLEDVEGLSPDREKHGSSIMLQPTLGMPMEFQTRIQTNIIMKKIRYNSKIAPFSNLALPILWIELEMDGLPTYITALLYVVVFIAPGLITAIVVIAFVSGVCLLVYSTYNSVLTEGCSRDLTPCMGPDEGSECPGNYSSPILRTSGILTVVPSTKRTLSPV